MTLAFELKDVVWQAPVSFVLGLIVGLAASSRWLIVRRRRNGGDE